jgi:hypothetical protein
MSYDVAMEAAGAKIHVYESFGSYQGDWWAKVTLPDGRTGWVNGSYGSCSGCDAFEAEFDYGSDDKCYDHRYSWGEDLPADCASCAEAKSAYDVKLSNFGAAYLDGLMTQAEAEAAAVRNIEWDSDASAMLAFIQQHA